MDNFQSENEGNGSNPNGAASAGGPMRSETMPKKHKRCSVRQAQENVLSLVLLRTSWVLVGHGACGVLLHGWSPHVQGALGRAAPQVIPARVVPSLVLHLDRDDAMGITRIPLFDPWSLLLEAYDRDGR